MQKKKLLGSQVKCLLANLADHGAQHLSEVETDLAQTNLLLHEAIEKLGSSFMAINGAVQAQNAAMELLLSGQVSSAEVEPMLMSTQSEIGLHVNAAVTALQFQDMTNQLIERAVRRVSGLREALHAAASTEAGLAGDSDAKEITALLSRVNKDLEDQSQKLKGTLWKAVSQTHMESGDIELF